MNNQNKQIIPDLQAVAHCSDGTFLISDLLENLKPPLDDQESFINQLKTLHLELKAGGYSRDHYRDKIEAFIKNNTIIENKEIAIIELFEDGIDCNLLQPDGKGWQKGKLTMCFQFTPEESESILTKEKSTEINHSPLDEIRQLANSLPIDQN
jgi:KGK domain